MLQAAVSIFLLINRVCSLLLGHWCTPCLCSCRLPTSLDWYSHWRHTPTFMTFMLEKDRVRVPSFRVCTELHPALLSYNTVSSEGSGNAITTYHVLFVCLSSDWPPWRSGSLVAVEVSGHPHHGHCAHVRLRRPRHWAHPAYSQPAQHLSGRAKHQRNFRFDLILLLCWCFSFFLQYFIGVTVLAMVPEIPEIVNGIQFALQNNISLR